MNEPNPAFEAWRDSMGREPWAKFDLSAARLGWDAAMAAQANASAPAETEPVAWRYRSSYDGTWQFWPADAWNEPWASPYLEAHPDADPLYIRNPSPSDGEVKAFIAAVELVEDAGYVVLRPDQIPAALQSSKRGQP